MTCEYGYSDCINLDKKCYLCIKGCHYIQPKKRQTSFKTKNVIKTEKSKRMGSISEVKSFNQMKEALNTSVTGTPNSGAGKIKGDEQIRGLINVMVELKTTVKKNLFKEPGKETFTIKKSWLDKLEREANEANMEFQYLKFSFKENDNKFYCITDSNQIIDMIVTMKNDRENLIKIQNEFDIYKKRAEYLDAKNTALIAKIEELKAKLKYEENKHKELF